MKEPGEILLIACYELGHQPLAVAWPLAFLERAGYAPATLDISVEPFDADRARRARFVAISVPMHTALRLGAMLAQRVRDVNSQCHICFYGLYALLNADYLLAHGADSVIAGEGEAALVELVADLERGPTPRSIPGVIRRGMSGPPRLDKLAFPVPSRASLPPLSRYAHLERDGQRHVVGHVEASRGCLHLCRHCPIPPVYHGRFFVVPREVCLADIRQQVDAGATHISFGDPDFLNGPGHALAVARDLHAEFPALTFDVTAKIEHLLRHRARLAELRDLGCLFIVSAAESLNDDVLAHLAKGHTRADIVAVLAAAREAGVSLRPTWVAFTPWTTLEGYREWLDFIEAEGLIDATDPVQYSIRLLVPPGSLLLESAAMRLHLGPLVSDGFHYHWQHPDPRMDTLQQSVARLVADAAERGEDPSVTFGHVRRLADLAAGETPVAMAALPNDRRRPPRLTESWFC